MNHPTIAHRIHPTSTAPVCRPWSHVSPSDVAASDISASEIAASSPDDAGSAQRVGDAERTDTATALGTAFTRGYLDLGEYESRLERAYAAHHRDELSALTADLPAAFASRPSSHQHLRRRNAGLGVRIHTGAAGLGVAVCWIVWAIIALTTTAAYPWPLWPTLGAAVGVLAHAASVRACSRTPQVVGGASG